MKLFQWILSLPTCLMLASLFTVSPSFAERGGGSTGGGVTVADKFGNRRLLDLLERDSLDYFIPDGVVDDLRYYGLQPINFISMLALNLAAYDSKVKYPETDLGGISFMFTLMASLDSRQLIPVWSEYKIASPRPLTWAFTDMPLENLNDEGLMRIENPETKKQVALQKDGLVVINRAEFNLMDHDSRVSLFLHEAVLRAVLILNPENIAENGTADVRAYTKQLFKFVDTEVKKLTEADYPAYPVKKAYDRFHIKEAVTLK